MNKSILFLLCLAAWNLSFGQSVVTPIVLRWDSAASVSYPTLLYADTTLMVVGTERGAGRFLAELDDSLKFTRKQFFNPGISLTTADYRYGTLFIGGIHDHGGNLRSYAAATVNPLTGFKGYTSIASNQGSLDFPNGIIATSDSGSIVYGMTMPPMTNRNIQLVKFGAGGSVEWENRYAQTSNSYANHVMEDMDGGFWVTGIGTNTFTGHSNGIFLLKVSSTGDSLWSTSFGPMISEGMKIIKTDDHHLIIPGLAVVNSGDQFYKPYLAKVDTLGNLIWETSYDYNLEEAWMNRFEMEDVEPTSDGGVVFIGTYSLYWGPAPGEYAYLLKIGPDGTQQWDLHLSNKNGHWLAGKSIMPTRTGTYALVLEGADPTSSAPPYTIYALLGPDGTFTDVERPALSSLALSLSPNPAGETVAVAWTQASAGLAEVRLLDVQGRLLHSSQLTQPAGPARLELPIEDLPAGVYLVEVVTGGKVGTAKLVKQ